METINPMTIKYAAYNPRILSNHDADSLDASMSTFGDISGITRNVQTNNYVTGHQRMRTLLRKFGDRVYIESETQHEPDEFGTVAVGYVKVRDTPLQFAFRSVSWSEVTEKTANISANRIEADWNKDMLAELNQQIAQFDNGAELLALTGQTQDEIDKLTQLGSQLEDDKPTPDNDAMSFKFTAEQAELVNEALSYVLAKHNVTTDNMDIRANAVHYICRDFLDRLHGLKDDDEQQANKEDYLAV